MRITYMEWFSLLCGARQLDHHQGNLKHEDWLWYTSAFGENDKQGNGVELFGSTGKPPKQPDLKIVPLAEIVQ